jgi:hypothetical protein
MKKYNTAVGVDPAFRSNGFCICAIHGCFNEIRFINYKNGFLDFLDDLKGVLIADKTTVIAIENSNLQNTSFDVTGSKGVIARKGRNVGSNQAISQLVVDSCNKYTKAKVLDLSPQRKGRKWNQAQFEAIVKQEGHKVVQKKKGNNQDERDAYKLALIALKELEKLNK